MTDNFQGIVFASGPMAWSDRSGLAWRVDLPRKGRELPGIDLRRRSFHALVVEGRLLAMGKARKPWSKKNHIKVAQVDWPELERQFGRRVEQINAAVRSYTRKTRTFTIHRLALTEDLAVELEAWQISRKGIVEPAGAPPAERAVG